LSRKRRPKKIISLQPNGLPAKSSFLSEFQSAVDSSVLTATGIPAFTFNTIPFHADKTAYWPLGTAAAQDYLDIAWPTMVDPGYTYAPVGYGNACLISGDGVNYSVGCTCHQVPKEECPRERKLLKIARREAQANGAA
jgi:hypothetical protein